MGHSDEFLSSKNLMLVENRNEIGTQIIITQKTGVMKGANKMPQEFGEGEITITESTSGFPSIYSPLFSFLTDL